MSKLNFVALLVGMSFAANSNVKKLLKSGKATDKELAAAATTTAPYKKDADFKKVVDDILNESDAPKAVEPTKSRTGRSGEPSRY